MVVAYDMGRELPRTLRALAPGYQRGLEGIDVEVIVVDNGSPVPLEPPADQGYDAAEEDRLLEACGWEADGYQLFTVSTLAASSGRGWFGPMGESSSLFLRRAVWDELGGLDERFALPGGGLANHDLYRRACEAAGTTLVVLPGEGTFHQIHGGAATSRRFGWDEMHADYVAVRDQPYKPPRNRPIYYGMIPDQAMRHAARSAELAIERAERQKRRSGDRG